MPFFHRTLQLHHDAQLSCESLLIILKDNVEMLLYLMNNQFMCISLMKSIYFNCMNTMMIKKKELRKNWKLELMKVLQYQRMKVHVDHCGKVAETVSSKRLYTDLATVHYILKPISALLWAFLEIVICSKMNLRVKITFFGLFKFLLVLADSVRLARVLAWWKTQG